MADGEAGNDGIAGLMAPTDAAAPETPAGGLVFFADGNDAGIPPEWASATSENLAPGEPLDLSGGADTLSATWHSDGIQMADGDLTLEQVLGDATMPTGDGDPLVTAFATDRQSDDPSAGFQAEGQDLPVASGGKTCITAGAYDPALLDVGGTSFGFAVDQTHGDGASLFPLLG